MFKIDTGAPGAPDTYAPPAIETLIPDWFRDMAAANTPPEQLAHDYGYHIIGAMQNPKTWPTVRKHILHDWRFLRSLADVHPDVFDEILQAYAERWQELA